MNYSTTKRNADCFMQDLHAEFKADFILANPPFNMSDWGSENLRQDMRWGFEMTGTSPQECFIAESECNINQTAIGQISNPFQL